MVSELLPRFREIAEEESAAGRLSGAVLVGHGDELVFADAYGLADRARRIPNRIDTRFRNGSITKMFTGVATVALIQAGEVDPMAPIGRYLPDYPNPELAAKVNAHHLLTHTGGTGDIFVPEYLERLDRMRTVADHVELLGHRGPRFEPGSRYEYSNYGFVLLGAVIEAVSGQDYHDFVDQRVFAPAGMTRTGALPEETAVPDLAIGYTTEDNGLERPNTDTLPYRGSPAGGGYTTVEDLWRFAKALLGHRLLDAEHTALVTTPQSEVGLDGRYAAYGSFANTLWGIRTFGHRGGAPGMSGDLSIWPESGYVVAALANLDPPMGQTLSDYVWTSLPIPVRGAWSRT